MYVGWQRRWRRVTKKRGMSSYALLMWFGLILVVMPVTKLLLSGCVDFAKAVGRMFGVIYMPSRRSHETNQVGGVPVFSLIRTTVSQPHPPSFIIP